MRRRTHATAVALIAAAGLTLAPAANAAVVPNIFVRSCYFGCSPYVQSNGAYKAQYPSSCVTKSWAARRRTCSLPAAAASRF